MSHAAPDVSQRQLQWRCRRGMRELDVLLERFLERDYVHADPRRRRAFADLLELPDPELHALFLGRAAAADEAQQQVLDAICRPAP